MKKPRPNGIPCGLLVALLIGATTCSSAKLSFGQQAQPSSAPIKVDRTVSRIELIAKTSRLLQFDYDVPELVVDNQAIVRATPIAADKVLLTALKPGIATITVSDADHRTQTLDVVVQGDVRALELMLQQLYPNSRIRATALESGVALTGTLARASDVQGALNVATEYFPTVHNYLKLPDSQLIAIEVQVYEVARSKVRELGIDWQVDTSNFNLSVAGANNPTNNLTFSVVSNGTTINGFLQALESQNLARLLDKPVLVTQNGRPAEFLEGGELPFQTSAGFGTTTIEFRPFGTKLDVVPIVQGEGYIRLEVRAEVSEPSQDLANDTGVSGFRVRRVNTGVDMKIGHTLALAGDIREEVEAKNSGIPGLKNAPYIGALFRKVQETRSEIELVMLLTPRFIGEVDPSLMPAAMPGRQSVSPSDCELYWNGHIEVPRCGPDCGGLPNQPMDSMGSYPGFAGNPSGSLQAPGANPENGDLPPVVKPDNVSGFGFPTPSTRPATPRTSSWNAQKFIRR
jgi:pilus assembly protein CpaC